MLQLENMFNIELSASTLWITVSCRNIQFCIIINTVYFLQSVYILSVSSHKLFSELLNKAS